MTQRSVMMERSRTLKLQKKVSGCCKGISNASMLSAYHVKMAMLPQQQEILLVILDVLYWQTITMWYRL